MPALIDIRRRICSVKNTQQITKAMAFSERSVSPASSAASRRERHSTTAYAERGRK
jgi:F0F1-type ATP synthase gamma subunit